jgi:quercetin dioxygenase-like cupin family protein/alkylhydroperoxidase/carboxymuconolactone decarboxylase family protein YurZ
MNILKYILITVITVFSITENVKAQDMEPLNSKQQKIATIAANTAIGDQSALEKELHAGLDAGLTVNQVKEVLVQMYAYAGFPRSLSAINTFITVLEERKAKDIQDEFGAEASPITNQRDKYTRGKEILQQLTGRIEDKPTGANAFATAIDVFLKEHLFVDIFERDILTYQQRELATISALSAMSGVEPMRNSHINMGRNTGLTAEQLNQINTIVQSSVGESIFPKGNPASPDQFTGTVWVQSLVSPTEIEGLYSVGQVTFEPEGKTNWHTHPAGQILLVTEGKGWYQERGKEPVLLKKGDKYVIPKDVEHWHGAARNSKFVHIAISNMVNGKNVTWMTPVTDEEYSTMPE